MKKNILFILIMLCTIGFSVSAHTYYIAVDGDDNNAGTKAEPFATLNKAQSLVQSGDTVYFRGGTYRIKPEQIMTPTSGSVWAHVFDMSKSGASENQRIHYFGYDGERPIFDMSDIKPVDRRVIAFYVSGSNLHFRNFEVVGTQVTIVGHTQSECFRNDGGNNNIFENLAMHDGMAIGFYLVRGANNLVLNCDAYNNFDYISDGGRGGNVDGFGGHPMNTTSTGNVFRGCRAWWNSDDGFDLINAHAAYTIENCWAFYNGYKPGTFEVAGDGAGIKSGGYGMSESPSTPSTIPMHIIRNNIAFQNNNQGLYANHHLGGLLFENNTGYRNPANYDMRTRKSREEAVDVDGYGHIIRHNLSFSPRTAGLHIRMVDQTLSQISNNSFLPVNMEVTADDFISLDESQLLWPRNPDGSLPDIDFLKLKTSSPFYAAGMGYFYAGSNNNVATYEWIEEPTIVVEHNVARVVGSGAGRFNSFFVNGTRVPFSTGRVNLTVYEGEIDLRAVTASGDVIRLKIVK
ncbi:right-handed parallel beta-helix repeat-containing protein [Sphingobacterium chuzhouense]|uniref:DUF4990 domain-containing protein n=1 Tax=Sphingobacterium chuzhouense TaxID=1742264 RepID=A0ABR7XMP4_9SPHI|nr:DUF4990 domain-containing protein [Sphingobacterium chuzhouense]MBD1420445.1 DUF4990 domain-containing protein [Sphingobacterium chuzhouense]